MKKFLTSLLCLLLATLANAASIAGTASWSEPVQGKYPDRFVVYVQLNENGIQVFQGATIAAFIGNECRGVVRSVASSNGYGFYPLEIWGSEKDNGKTVTFKAECSGYAYNFTKTLTYAHQTTYKPSPFVLNIDKVTGVTIDKPINIVQSIGTTYDLNKHVAFKYEVITPVAGGAVAYTPKKESTLDSSTPVTVIWAIRSNMNTISPNGMLNINAVENEVYTVVGIRSYDGTTIGTAGTYLNISEPLVTVTDLTFTTSAVECWVGENVTSLIQQVTNIVPSNATNKNLIITPVSGSDAGFTMFDTGLVANKAGTWSVEVKSAANTNVKKVIKVIVKQHVSSLTASKKELTVELGDNVYNKVAQLITVLPSDATDKTLQYATRQSGYVDGNGNAIKEGDVVVVVKSNDNVQITVDVTVHIVSSVKFTVPTSLQTTLSSPATLQLTGLAGNGFNAANVSIAFANAAMATATKDATGLKFTVTGHQLGNTTYTVSYSGKAMGTGTLYVDASIDLKAGWNWVSNYTDKELTLLDDQKKFNSAYFSGNGKIEEIRTESALLFNDPTYGMFGRIYTISPTEMYKINATAARNIVFRPTGVNPNSVTVTRKGYTWIVYPIVGDHTFTYINNNNYLARAASGDMIIGKDGFASYDGSKWVAQIGFILETGKGYIYYQENAATKPLDFGKSYVSEGTASRAKAKRVASDVWQYDASAYPDNMCIIAKIADIEASDSYSVGAFVNGECRGKGSFVNDEVLFISVAGTMGETVTFRLYNSDTQEYTDIAEKMTYTMVKGSLASPALLSKYDPTGIKDVYVNANDSNNAYNLSGQRVDASAKGIVIKGGKKLVVR